MAEVTIEIDDKGNIGTLPEPVQKFLDGRINDAFKRGAAKVEAELKDRTMDPAEKERLKLLEQENAKFKEEKALADKNYEEARRLQEERLSKIAAEKDEAIKARDAEVTRRTARLKSMLGSEIRAAAVAAGARDESLPELVKLLGADVDLDDDLQPVVKGEDGNPLAGKDGKPISIEGFVTQYLAEHPHHLRGSRGVPGKAQDGAAFRRAPASTADTAVEDSLAAVASNPSTRTIAGAVRSIRSRAAN